MPAKRAKSKESQSRKSRKTKRVRAARRSAKSLGAKRKRRQRIQRGRASTASLVAYEQRGLGAHCGGQSGDTQGLAANASVDSESVEELLEEGQSFEAEVLDGVENAPDPDQSEVHTREVSEEDVPAEHRETR